MMVEINIIIAIFMLSLLSFMDFIVFNEEILLTLCFLSFLFYCFNTLSESIFSTFETRASKFEEDLLVTYEQSKQLFILQFNSNLKLRNFIDNFNILLLITINFISICKNFLSYKSSWIYFQVCLSKLNELTILNNNYTLVFQKACVVQLLYSLILKKSSNNLNFKAFLQKKNTNLIELKYLCF